MTSIPGQRPGAGPSGDAATILEGIVRKRCVTAMYNREVVTLAPHALFTRHGDLHVDAITRDRGGKPPREVKVGTFKLVGLGSLTLTDQPFDVSPLFKADDPKYGGEVIMTVDP